ncbi:hypothetical protein [Kitasatospora griseola]|uniref:hypothetical protein n=1 Tax=Kitasatospora griseola TaxID=2064 RepID=UPI0016706A54|nr:hypothetical protein [Kitasatospora griseola]GGQ59566.1 hypothetical protein GCM10010195_14000 [Kitasatospora griseola]
MLRLIEIAVSAARAVARPFRSRRPAHDHAEAHRAEVGRDAAAARHHRSANHSWTGGGPAQ